jgi:hypothetical protein
VLTFVRSTLVRASCGLALSITTLAPAVAGQVAGWWGGSWSCTIDGRPARMRWVPVDDTQTSCDGSACTSAAGARWKGSFSDNGSRWVALSHATEGNHGGLFFRHADGNRWYLAKPVGNRSTGWTTWNGQRYPLACWR